jgi:hypothetical protein
MGGITKNLPHCHRIVTTIIELKHALFHSVDYSAKIIASDRATICDYPQSKLWFLLFFFNHYD